MADFHPAIAARASEQHGLLTIADLDERGMSREGRRHLIRSGVLLPLYRGVYAVAGSPKTAQRNLLAACLAVGPGTVVSHRSAAWLWRFPGATVTPPELTIVERRRAPDLGLRVHRTTELDDIDRTRLEPYAVTTPARTIIDCAASWTAREIEAVVDVLVRDRVVDECHLADRAHGLRRRGRQGVAKVLAVLGADEDPISARPESWLERELLRILRAAGLPLPECQLWVSTPAGRFRIDFAYADLHLAIEVDGYGTHSTRHQLQSDHERTAALTLAGWHVLRFTYDDIRRRPAYVLRTIRDFRRVVGS